MSEDGSSSKAVPKPKSRVSGLVVVAAAVVVVIVLLTVARPLLPGGDSAGSQARDFASDRYAKLVVEVDWLVEGGTDHKPTQAVLTFLQQRLSERLTKPGGIVVQFGNAITAAHASYGVSELRQVESANRAARTGGDTAAMYLLFANHYAASASTIGVAYSGSAAAIFGGTIDDASTFAVSSEAIERITTLHEVGHLLGLVNLGTPMVTPHEDAAHPGHSASEDSVMYWAVEGTDIISLFFGGAPDNFDANDIADLRAIGGR